MGIRAGERGMPRGFPFGYFPDLRAHTHTEIKCTTPFRHRTTKQINRQVCDFLMSSESPKKKPRLSKDSDAMTTPCSDTEKTTTAAHYEKFTVGTKTIDPKEHPDLLFDKDPAVNVAMYKDFQWETYCWPTGTNFFLATDIEKTGARPNTGFPMSDGAKYSFIESPRKSHVVSYIPALGAVAMRLSDGKVMDSFFQPMNPPSHGGFSKVCKEEFWEQPANAANLEKWSKNNVEYFTGLENYRDWLYQMQEKYAPAKMALCFDSTTDVSFLDAEFDARLDTNPLHHPQGEESQFRRNWHTNEFAKGLGRHDGSDGTDAWKTLRDAGVPLLPEELHDHNPLNDATQIAGTIRACHVWIRLEKAKDAVFGPAVRSTERIPPLE